MTHSVPTRRSSDLKGSAYDDVSVRQLLTMTSGVKWNEDYTDPKSDVAQFNLQAPVPGEDITVSYMKRLPREAPAGSKWVYKRSEEHTSELQSLMRISYAVFCLKKTKQTILLNTNTN